MLLNVWALYIFGSLIERLMGSATFALYFFFCTVLIGAINITTDIEGWQVYRGGGNIIMSLFFAAAYFFPNNKITLLIPIPASLAFKYWIAIFFFASLAVVLYKMITHENGPMLMNSFFNFGNMLAMVIAFLFLRFHPQMQRLKSAIEYQQSMDNRIDEIGKKEDE
jgi:membrane associated rhomboid family serine protease